MNDIIRLDISVTDIRRREGAWKARAELFSGDFNLPLKRPGR